MPGFLIVTSLIAIATLHWFRPDITITITTYILQKVHHVPVRQWISVILDGIATGNAMLKGLLANITLYVHRLESLPWGEYCDQAATLVQSIESWSTFLEQALSKAGHPWAGCCVYVAIYIGAVMCVWILAVTVRWLISIIWVVTAWILGTVWLVLCWVLYYPVRCAFGLLYRLRIDRNRNDHTGPPPLAAPVGQNAGDHLD